MPLGGRCWICWIRAALDPSFGKVPGRIPGGLSGGAVPDAVFGPIPGVFPDETPHRQASGLEPHGSLGKKALGGRHIVQHRETPPPGASEKRGLKKMHKPIGEPRHRDNVQLPAFRIGL